MRSGDLTPVVLAALASLAVCASPAAGQDGSVSIEDLAGHTIQSTVATRQTVRSAYGVTTHPVTYTATIKVGSGGKMKVTGVTRTVLGNGEARVRTTSYDVELGKPYQSAQGHQVWILENSQLVRIATMKEGGNKLAYQLSKQGGTIKCALAWLQAPQVGVGRIASSGSATATGNDIEVLEQTEISKTCRVSR